MLYYDQIKQAITDYFSTVVNAGAIVTDLGQSALASGLPSGENHLGNVTTNGDTITSSLTLPSTSSGAYAEGDVVGSLLTFSNVARINGGCALLLGATAVVSSNQATLPQLRLELFSSAPTVASDNAQFAPSNADLNNLIGIVDFSYFRKGNYASGTSGNAYSVGVMERSTYLKTVSGKNVYGVLRAMNAYTATNSEAITINLQVGART